MAYIHCNNCGKVIPAEMTHNGVCSCWLGHCCGFGQDAAIGDEITEGTGTKVIRHGADAGKTEAQLIAEVFDPNVSDLEYFQSRLKALKATKELDNQSQSQS